MSQFKVLLERVKKGENIKYGEIREALELVDVWKDSYEDALLQLVYFAGMIEASDKINKVE